MEYVNIPFEDRSSRWPVQSKVGSGRHGTTFLVRDPATNETRIMKQLQFVFTDSQASSYDEYAHEVEVHINISRLFPAHVPRVFDYWVHDNTGHIVMEYFQHGEHPILTSMDQFNKLCGMWKDIATHGYYHGDFKTPNIFCRDAGATEPVIGDWGIAVYLPAFTTEAMNVFLSKQLDMLGEKRSYRAIYELFVDMFRGTDDDRRPLIAKMLEFEMMWRLHYGFPPELALECGKIIQQEIIDWIKEVAPNWEINATTEFFDTFVCVIGWIRDNLWLQSLQAHRRQSVRALTEDIVSSGMLLDYITRDDVILPLISRLPKAQFVDRRQCQSSVRRRLKQLLLAVASAPLGK